jgi:hypothetical protein
MVVRGLLEREHGMSYRLTEQGRAANHHGAEQRPAPNWRQRAFVGVYGPMSAMA